MNPHWLFWWRRGKFGATICGAVVVGVTLQILVSLPVVGDWADRQNDRFLDWFLTWSQR